MEIKIEKLTSSNYYKWKEDIKCALTIRDWWCAVVQSATFVALDPEQRRIRSQQAYAGLLMTISSDLRTHVASQTTPKDLWDTLAAIFKKKSIGDKRILQKELQSLKCKKNEDVLAYVSRAKTLRTQLLDACGVNTSDSELVDVLLDGLGNEYADFKSHVAYADAGLSLDDFIQKLHSASAIVRKQRDVPAQAFVAHKPVHGAPRKAPFKPRGRCHKCHKFGHWARDCPDNKKQSANAPVGQKHLAFSATVTYRQSRIDEAPTDNDMSDGAGTSAQYLRNRQVLNDEIHAAGIALAMKDYFAREGLSPGRYSTLMFRRQIHMCFNTAVKYPELDTPFEILDKNAAFDKRVKLPTELYPCDGFNTSDDEGHYTFDEIMAEHSVASENNDDAPLSLSFDEHTLATMADDTDESAQARGKPPAMIPCESDEDIYMECMTGAFTAAAMTHGDCEDTVMRLVDKRPDRPSSTTHIPADATAEELPVSTSCLVAGALKAPVHTWSSPDQGLAGVIEYTLVHGDEDIIHEEAMVCDAGSQHHMVCSKHLIRRGSLVLFPDNQKVEVHGVGGCVRALGTCACDFHLSGVTLTLNNVLYVPDAKVNLMSVSQACESNNMDFVFSYDGVFVQGPNFPRTRLGRVDNRLYKLIASVSYGEDSVITQSYLYAPKENNAYIASVKKPQDLMHRRLGHISHPVLQRMVREQCVHGLPDKYGIPDDKCDVCLRAKQARPPFEENLVSATRPLELVHADVMGPFQEQSLAGSMYALVMLDDYSRYTAVKCLAFKSDVPEALLQTLAYWQTQLETTLKILRTDRGTEFCNATVNGYCNAAGILHQLSAAYTPQQNGRVERINRTLMDRGRALLLDSGLPNKLWAEALMTGMRIYNVTLPARADRTPFEAFWSRFLTSQACVCSAAKPTCKSLHTNGRSWIPKAQLGPWLVTLWFPKRTGYSTATTLVA
jgi:transposase InsO family protein